MLRPLRDETGSAVAEFVMVGVLLTVATLAVLQLALALLVRNTVLDAASEGARHAAMVGNSPEEGAARTAELIRTAVGASYADDVRAGFGDYLGAPAIVITVRAPLPVLGLIGPTGGIEVSGHAPIETLD